MTSPWPESIFAFAPIWTALAQRCRVVAVDLPGFGGSERRDDLLSPRAMGDFLLELIAQSELDGPHLVAPDIGTSAALFAAASQPRLLSSLVVGSGGAAVPLQLEGPLAEWVLAPDLDRYRAMDPRAIVAAALDTIEGYALPPEIRDDYLDCYDGDRFVESMRYARTYPDQLPEAREASPRDRDPRSDHRRPARSGGPARQCRVPPREPARLPARRPRRRALRVGGGRRRVRVHRRGLGDGRLPRCGRDGTPMTRDPEARGPLGGDRSIRSDMTPGQRLPRRCAARPHGHSPLGGASEV